MKKKIFSAVISAFILQEANAQWVEEPSGLTDSQSIFELSASGPNNCYGNVFDFNVATFINEMVATHDGGVTWQAITIDSLANNFFVDLYASSGKVVHVIGWDTFNGGGNAFKSKDGGLTWAREASHAYTDPSSFPDAIAFFNDHDGVIFGDPVNGVFEIYTTPDNGKHWHKVSDANIPPALDNEFGVNTWMETTGNSAWAVVYVSDDGGNSPTHTRLLQSDDKGKTWYVRNDSLPIEAFFGTVKFRDHDHGLLMNNGKLYRTTDGGTTYTPVNYTGNLFTWDIDFVKNVPGCWISTGPGDLFGTNEGSSITYDDGDSWKTIDTGVAHVEVEMVNKHHGFTGGITTGNLDNGAFYYSPGAFKFNASPEQCGEMEFTVYPNPTAESFSLLFHSTSNDVCSLHVYDIEGRLVVNEKFAANEVFQFGNNLLPGLYLAQVISGNEKHTMRVIKQ